MRVEAHFTGTPNPVDRDVLANDVASLQARGKGHRHVDTSADPEPATVREPAATTTARVNGRVHCPAVHAWLFAAVAQGRPLAQTLLDEGWRPSCRRPGGAVGDAAAKLAIDREGFAAADLAPPRARGFDNLAILGAFTDAAVFVNVNRTGPPTAAARP